MTESTPREPNQPQSQGRRSLFLMIGVALNAIAGALVAAPIVGFLFSAAKRERILATLDWVSLGTLDAFPEGQTRMATFRNPTTQPWDGATGNIPCWVRRTAAGQFQVFAINCAHLGCPVRWFPQSGLFMCPCHGGAYYADGARASGPPHTGLFKYKHKVEGDQLWIVAGMMPTPGKYWSSTDGGRKPCA